MVFQADATERAKEQLLEKATKSSATIQPTELMGAKKQPVSQAEEVI
jgi:hypothetical protein